jgi:hypothetical protein
MNPLLALTVTAALAGPPVGTEYQAVAIPRPFAEEGVVVQASKLRPSFAPDEANGREIAKAAKSWNEIPAATASARAFKGDSLKNGAIIGGVLAGAGMGGFIYWLCNALDDTGGDANCGGPALIYGGLFAAGGAALGAGIGALVDRKPVWEAAKTPAFRVRVKF